MHDLYRIIDEDPNFHALQRARSRFAWCLLACVLGGYYSFIGVIAFAPAWFARPLNTTTTVTVGIVAGLAVMGVSLILTGWYVWRANREFDVRNLALIAEVTRRAAIR